MLLSWEKADIIQDYLADTTARRTASEIAREQDRNQKTVYLYLEALTEHGILETTRQGRNKLYHLTRTEKTRHFLCAAEHLNTIQFYEKHPEIEALMQTLLPHIHGAAAIFGSHAKGTATRTSDIDLYILGPYDEERTDECIQTYQASIDTTHYDAPADDALTREVRKHHVILKGTETFITELQWKN